MNANQAERVPVLQDVVTLTNRIPVEQEARGDRQFTTFERLALPVDDTGVSIGSNGEATDGYSPQVPGATVSNQTGFAAMLQQNPSPADVALAANTAADQETGVSIQTNAASSMTPQQELAQLDQTLQEIGINPQKSAFSIEWRCCSGPITLLLSRFRSISADGSTETHAARRHPRRIRSSSKVCRGSAVEPRAESNVDPNSRLEREVGIKVIATQLNLADSEGTFPMASAGRTSQPVTINTAVSNSARSALDVIA